MVNMKLIIIAAICLQVSWATPVRSPFENGLFQGDILLDDKQRNGMILETWRWRKGVVPYVIEGSFDEHELRIINLAFQHYHENTCIQFVPKTAAHHDYIAIVNGKNGCFADPGRRGKGRQIVNLGKYCFNGEQIGIAVHELMHSLGFWHEQNRSDRDDYLTINLDLVPKDMQFNFDVLKRNYVNDLGIKYDYNSVMQYQRNAFSSNNNLDTMTPKEPIYIGQLFGLSSGDVEKIRRMYAIECYKW